MRQFGLDPTSDAARRAIELVRRNARWEHEGEVYFEGEVEPCINGQTVGMGAYFGADVRRIVDRLLTEQMDDGGWNCEQENGSTRGSFETTINVLAKPPPTAVDQRARTARWLYLAFPRSWHYDVLRVLDHLRDAGVAPDERMTEAIGMVESKRGADGRWELEHAHHDQLGVDFGESPGGPSRWITLQALRVLRWAGIDF